MAEKTDKCWTGGCLCGRVTFKITPPTKWCAHCHCSMCRAAHGAAFVTWFGVPEAQFELTSGEEDLRWYASSEQARRGFCQHCGSTMLFESSRWSGEAHVALGAMKDLIDREPKAHVFFDSHVSYVRFDDGLPRMGGPSGTEPLEGDGGG